MNMFSHPASRRHNAMRVAGYFYPVAGLTNPRYWSVYDYGCTVDEVTKDEHRPVHYTFASDRHLYIEMYKKFKGWEIAEQPIIEGWGHIYRICVPEMNVPKGEGMMEVKKFAISADEWCARLREQTRQSRIQRNADPDTGLPSKTPPYIKRQLVKLRSLINHPSTEEWQVKAAKAAIERLIRKAETLNRKRAE